MAPTSKVATLAKTTATAFAAIRNAHPDDNFYFYALYTTADGGYVTAAAWSEEALARVVGEYRKRDRKRSADALSRSLRFSAADSPYQSAPFTGVRPGPALHDACFDALKELERTGFFGRGARRARGIVNVVYGDMSDERWLAHAERLNPAAAVDAARPFLRLHVPTGRVKPWGARVRDVNAMSLSTDRKLVAYSGSGGAVGLLQVAKRQRVFEKERRGEYWACALAPDGSKLYLTDERGIAELDPKSGKTTLFAKTGKPHCLAASADGTLLATSSFDAPLRMFDTSTRKPLWEARGLDLPLAFAPSGNLIAVVREPVGKKGAPSLDCLDARSGKVRWSAPLPAGDRCFAWTANGDEIVVACSTSELLAPDYERYRDEATVRVVAAKDGRVVQQIPWAASVEAIAVSPSGGRIAVCAREAVFILDRKGSILARGTGGQESLSACAFVDDTTVLAVGSNVNLGPALLELSTAN